MSILVVLLLTLVTVINPPSLHAQSATGISVSPAMLKIDLATDPDEFVLKYQNSTSSVMQLNFSAKDFTGLEEGWRVKFLNPEEAKNYHYSLSSWLDFQPPSLLLKPGETGFLTVAIRQENLSPGGHYASIVADILPSLPDPGTIAIKSQLVSLAFIRAHTGYENDAARILNFTLVRNNPLSLPHNYSFRFDNTGNTQLTPHGYITVSNIFGRTITKDIINSDSLITLPESIRKYEVSAGIANHPFTFPGRYQAVLTVNYGTDQSQTTQTVFYTLGGKYIVYLETGIILIIFMISKYTKTRKQNRPKTR